MSKEFEPNADELAHIDKAVDRLWKLDENNRLKYGTDYEILLQKERRRQDGDVADKPLFVRIDPDVLKRPTFETFIALLDNYEASIGKEEDVTPDEVIENNRFLTVRTMTIQPDVVVEQIVQQEIIKTKPIKYLERYLTLKGHLKGKETLKTKLYSLWFAGYKRDKSAHKPDSSGFEHVFVGEVGADFKTGETIVKGMHNWIQIYIQEKNKMLDYRGWQKPKFRGVPSQPFEYEQVLSMQFQWDKSIKPYGTSLLGVTPEFEIALYTMCFLCGNPEEQAGRGSRTPVTLGPYSVEIVCHKFGGQYIGTSYPEEYLPPDKAATKIQANFRSHVQYRNFQNKRGGGGRRW